MPAQLTIAVLGNPSGDDESPLALLASIEDRGHRPVYLAASQLGIEIRDEQAVVTYDGSPVTFDAAVSFVDVIADRASALILETLQTQGIPCVNSVRGFETSEDKVRAAVKFAAHRVRHPSTALVRSERDVFRFADRYGYPLVLKVPDGWAGSGVVRAATPNDVRPLMTQLGVGSDAGSKQQFLLVQQYIEAGGQDIRIFVVGGKAVAGERRVAPEGDFRTNISLGGQGSVATFSTEEAMLAVRATQAVGLDYCGVDISRGSIGSSSADPYVIETNALASVSPQQQRIFGVDLTGLIVDLVVQRVLEAPTVQRRASLASD